VADFNGMVVEVEIEEAGCAHECFGFFGRSFFDGRPGECFADSDGGECVFQPGAEVGGGLHVAGHVFPDMRVEGDGF
jgi:hypothetical protein